jgi:P4 family phage/plasmid primase-like protien
MFILQGQSNSGKTQLTELVQGVFGDYAVSVSPGTFAKRHDSSGPNPELHDIRSARFVYSSETSHDLALDEELVKRVTGKDTMSTRTLYEKSQRWIPQCVVWVATNNLPRFGSDSEAIWRRVKTVRFVNEFTEDGSSGHVAQPNIGRNLAQAEASGVFNLLLEALRRYRAAGRLVEPSELKESVATHRQETDPVAQWVAHVRDKGQLVARPGGRTDQKVLRKAYETWCADEGFRPLAANRFGVALAQNLDYERLRSNGDTWVVGWHWTGSSWAVGQAIFGDWRDRE